MVAMLFSFGRLRCQSVAAGIHNALALVARAKPSHPFKTCGGAARSRGTPQTPKGEPEPGGARARAKARRAAEQRRGRPEGRERAAEAAPPRTQQNIQFCSVGGGLGPPPTVNKTSVLLGSSGRSRAELQRGLLRRGFAQKSSENGFFGLAP